ncbi:MAG TPA: exodeoxyribonuclease VII large subunit, partial [Dokdonella sp.]|nr:exodeoxyribonuclease VII large subunit [Dokdonella sp.]
MGIQGGNADFAAFPGPGCFPPDLAGVADLRAPTPTAAAVAVSRDRLDDLARLAGLAQRLYRAGERGLLARDQALDLAARRLRSPQRQLRDRRDALQGLSRRLGVRLQRQVGDAQLDLQRLQARLRAPA